MKKICKNCGIEFERQYNSQKYCSKECSKIVKSFDLKKYRNSEKGKESQKEYQKTEKYKEYKKKYNQTEAFKAAVSKYHKTENGKIAINIAFHKRRALKKQVLHEDYKDWLKELRSHKFFICHWCGKKFSIDKLNLDHVVPLSKGGVDTKENLVPCCKSCNSAKRDKDPEQFNETLEQPRLII